MVSSFPFSALTPLVERQEGDLDCKKLGVGLLVVMIWLELCMSYSFSCHHHLHYPYSNEIWYWLTKVHLAKKSA